MSLFIKLWIQLETERDVYLVSGSSNQLFLYFSEETSKYKNNPHHSIEKYLKDYIEGNIDNKKSTGAQGKLKTCLSPV